MSKTNPSPIPIGSKFGRWTVLGRAESTDRDPRILCRCDCGTTAIVNARNVYRGRSKSCGCWNRDSAAHHDSTTHGHTRGRQPSPTYQTWRSMVGRCAQDASPNWKYYGGRGITVCERWREFENFLADMRERPEGRTLDRIDPDGNYEPANCRWATPAEQTANRRPR